MKSAILYLVPDLFGPPGGIARHCRMVCLALLEAGLAVKVVALRDSPATRSETSSVLRGAAYWPCRGSRGSFVLRALSVAAWYRPRTVLLGHPNLGPLGYFLARSTGARMVTFIHGIEVWEPMTLLRRWTLQRADQIISVSRFTAWQAELANQLPAEKVRILYHCLDPEFERRAQGQQNMTVSGLSFLTVSRMSQAEQNKGHDDVIRAMPLLLEQFPELIYNVVGDGDGRPALELLAKQLGVAEAVKFRGFVSEAELAWYYAQASVFVMPSRAEGFGFVFLEAMSQGVPVVGGSTDATPEVIVDGKTGYLVDPTSVAEIAATTSRLLGDKGLRQQMGQAAKRRVEQEFQFSRFRHTLLAYLTELGAVPPG